MASTKKNSDAKTEVLVRTFATNEDVLVPTDEEIVSVDYDRSMAVTRVVTKRAYDADRTQEEKDARSGAPATPTYTQPAGAVSAPAVAPNNHFSWGSIDTTKVQNLEAVKDIPNEQMPEGLQPHPVEGLTGDPAGLPPEAVDENVSATDAGERAEAQRSPEEAAKQDTIVSGSTAAEGDNPRVSADQKVKDGKVE